ncbi:MAG: hypothetical protein NZV14_04235 [Bryobacteraceae bacterium]|nr:hypothetical protein [Bryobacteraceae bacterium]MDW8377341.1 hypothetical protein [Bryobacterales bacterium]
MRPWLGALVARVLLACAALGWQKTPFWDRKQPHEWSDEELLQIMTDSPWAQVTQAKAGPPVGIYLASAPPLQVAEKEWLRRYSSKSPQPSQDSGLRQEYEHFLKENLGHVIVLAVRHPKVQALASADELQRMEEESFLKDGRKKLKMTGHFPPVPSDPVLRLVFPRPASAVRELVFELYLPGVSAPYRQAVFTVKDLVYRGEAGF